MKDVRLLVFDRDIDDDADDDEDDKEDDEEDALLTSAGGLKERGGGEREAR